ncbi:MAG: class I SAM-dependent methyltransferase [Firmicutes bacterium]|nr:class I SAM-dependent methyltransferase [Bacillota bacterium]
MKKESSSRLDWYSKMSEATEESRSFISHWDFKMNDGSPYYTIDPENVSQEWIDLQEPASVFDVPEVWYGLERLQHPTFDNWVWHEVGFCQTLWEKYSAFPVEYVLESCCGICPHGSVLARMGKSVVGVDSSTGMVKAANARAEVQDLNLKAYERDVFKFSLPGPSPDAALLLSNIFPIPYHNKTDNEALISQLRSVGYYIKRGGLYIIDCGYPEPPRIVTEENVSHSQMYDLGYAKVSMRTLTYRTKLDTWETPYSFYYTVDYPTGSVHLKHNTAKSFITAQHLLALVEASGIFTLEAFHHWGNPEPGLFQGGGAYVAVLRRK